MDAQRPLLPKQPTNLEGNDEESLEEEEEWTDGSSYSSYYSDSDSSTIPDWEPYVDDHTGELLYIECHPFVTQNKEPPKPKIPSEPFSTKNQLRRSTRGKFLRLIRRRESKRRTTSKKAPKNLDQQDGTSKVKFQDFQEGEEKEVLLEIDKDNRHNLSSDVSLAESLLGLNVSTLSDGYRVMIAGFSLDSKAKYDRNIKIGDWLKSINNLEVNYHNLEDILQKFFNRDEVLLKLQRVAGIDVTKDPPIHELNNESNFVRELMNSKSDDEQLLLQTLTRHPISILFVDTDKLSETNNDNQDVIYCYPRPIQKNILCTSRGLFITLNHLLKEVTKSQPRTASIMVKNRLCNIVFSSFDQNILFLMLPDNRASLREVTMINEELIRLLEFTYGSLTNSLGDPDKLGQLDHFFSRFFTRLLSSGLWATAEQFVELQSISTKSKQTSPAQFEDIISAAVTLTLPEEALSQIDDALTEMEASDYRDWNEEPLDCQRLFTILGSALYHTGYLLATHFIHEDLKDVHVFLKQQGLLHLSRTEPVKSLVLWREVFPYSCNRIKDSLVPIPKGRRYLLIVGSAKNLLAVIMEAGGCTEPAEENMGPDAFYVEEVQATLAHIQEMGVPELADRFLNVNPGAQVVLPQPPTNKKKNDFMSTLTLNKSSSNTHKDTVSPTKKNEVTSILKRRSTDQSMVQQYNSSGSLQEDFDRQSEGSSQYSELSDERATTRKLRYDSNEEEESDIDDYGEGSQVSSSSFDISELRQNLLQETEDSRPTQITTGLENVLYFFIQLDITEGILICPTELKSTNQTMDTILNNFRRCCHRIHALFQNTLRFKNMPVQEMAKSVMNKSLIAIKEHGIVFECPYLDDNNKKGKIVYWVIGKLLFDPHPREVYVCYQDSIPQNMIELAFKLSMNTIS